VETANISKISLPAEVSGEKGKKDDSELKKACQDFEALFVGEMFKSMRKTVPDGGLVKKGNGEEMYREMLDMEVASNLSRSKGIGLGDALYRQLAEESSDISTKKD